MQRTEHPDTQPLCSVQSVIHLRKGRATDDETNGAEATPPIEQPFKRDREGHEATYTNSKEKSNVRRMQTGDRTKPLTFLKASHVETREDSSQ